MQFTVTGSKAKIREGELTIHDLTTKSRKELRRIQRRRIIHAIAWERYPFCEEFYGKAVIEIEGVFVN
jgi:ribosomal protein L35